MIKQSKLSKICWAFVYLFPLIYGALMVLLLTDVDADSFYSLFGVFEGELPFISLEFFSVSPLYDLMGDSTAFYLDRYLGYLVLVSLFRIVWKVLVYLPDVVGKLIDRWSL